VFKTPLNMSNPPLFFNGQKKERFSEKMRLSN
jgi:hypothetical protein